MTNFNELLDLSKSIITTYKQKELILLNGYVSGAGSFDFEAATKRTETLIDAYSQKIPKFEGEMKLWQVN